MKLLRLIIVGILVLWIFDAELLSQFHVESKIELSIDIENGHPDPPSRIVLVGTDTNNRKVYFVKIGSIRDKKYTIYDVKPGKYLISFSSYTGGVFSEIQVVTLYNTQKQAFRSESFVRNEIEVHYNRNLKLDLLFKTNIFSGFDKEMEKQFRDFDYIKFVYYSSLSTYTNAINNYYRKSNMFLTSNEMPELKGPSLQDNNEEENNNIPVCGSSDFCGQNSGDCKVDINKDCERDGGNINITLKSIYFRNVWLGEIPTGMKIGETIIGTQDSNGDWRCGVTSISLKNLIGEGTAGAPSNWPKTEVKYECDTSKKKCKCEFKYYAGVVMETAVWGFAEMCAHCRSYQNKDLINNLCFCKCFFEATIAHEAKHCETWRNSILEDIGKYCASVGNYTADCCEDADSICKKQSEILEWDIFIEINDFVSKLGRSPESASDKAESSAFNQCILLNLCK
jgi:hypothetical protein